MDEDLEAGGGFVVAGADAAVLLEPADALLHPRTSLVRHAVEPPSPFLLELVAALREHLLDDPTLQPPPDRRVAVLLVARHLQRPAGLTCPPNPDPAPMRVPTDPGRVQETLEDEADEAFGGADRDQAA